MSIPAWARKGAKVICVDASPPMWGWSLDPLVTRAIYQIEAVTTYPAGVYLVLVEAKSDTHSRGYRLDRFRPLVTLEDDMAAHFTRLLDATAPIEAVEV